MMGFFGFCGKRYKKGIAKKQDEISTFGYPKKNGQLCDVCGSWFKVSTEDTFMIFYCILRGDTSFKGSYLKKKWIT